MPTSMAAVPNSTAAIDTANDAPPVNGTAASPATAVKVPIPTVARPLFATFVAPSFTPYAFSIL